MSKFLSEKKIELGIDKVQFALKKFGNPENSLKFIHVAGTNGKGSTSRFISEILIESGLSVGLFTSPHLLRVEERIQLNNYNIKNSKLKKLIRNIDLKMKIQNKLTPLTYFEKLTVAAFLYFFENKSDVVILETGLGGRLDATNVIKTPLASVITKISKDHAEFLGNTLNKITREKCGIIKSNNKVILYNQSKRIKKIVKKKCKKLNSDLEIVKFNEIKFKKMDLEGTIFDLGELKDLKIKLLGQHQTKNAAVAISVIQNLRNYGFNIKKESIKRGLLKTNWPFRFEILSNSPIVIGDGAHNLDATIKLINNLEFYFKKKIIFVIGIFKDKEYKKMLKVASNAAKEFHFITLKNQRSASDTDLQKASKNLGVPSFCYGKNYDNLVSNLKHYSKNEIFCAFGSLSIYEILDTLFPFC